jgi:hypothetical protein
MSNIRNLKKDINYLSAEFVADSYIVLHLHPDSAVAIESLVDKVIDARNELIGTIHHPENKHTPKFNKNREVVKQRNIVHKALISKSYEEFLSLIDQSYEEIQKLNKE